jgi:hypothetical protein
LIYQAQTIFHEIFGAAAKFLARRTMLNTDYSVISRKNGYLGLSICFLFMSAVNFFDPVTSRPSGSRWGAFFALIWDHFGSNGIWGYWLLMSVLFFACFLGSKK